MRIIKIFLPGLLFFISGCFYSFNPGGEPLINSIAVTQFENNTVEVGITSRLTELVVDGLITDGTLKVMSESSAEGILYGTLTSYERKPYAYDEADQVSEYIVNLSFEIKLVKRDSDENIWSDTFFSDGIFKADTETEEDGQNLAIDKLVQNIINKTTKSW